MRRDRNRTVGLALIAAGSYLLSVALLIIAGGLGFWSGMTVLSGGDWQSSAKAMLLWGVAAVLLRGAAYVAAVLVMR